MDGRILGISDRLCTGVALHEESLREILLVLRFFEEMIDVVTEIVGLATVVVLPSVAGVVTTLGVRE